MMIPLQNWLLSPPSFANNKPTALLQQQHQQRRIITKKLLRLFLLAVFLSWMAAQCVLLIWWKGQHTSFSLLPSLSLSFSNSKLYLSSKKKGWINGIIPLELVDLDDDSQTRSRRLRKTGKRPQKPQRRQPLVSTIHCVGETFLNNSWWYKSCHFTHLCYHVVEKEFHYFHNDDQDTLEWRNATNVYSSTLLFANTQLSPGGIIAEEPRRLSLPWFPRIISSSSIKSSHFYWHIPSRPVLIPFFPRLANNAGHLIWDNWLPLYQLLRMFDLLPRFTDDTLLSSYSSSSSAISASPHVVFHNLRNKGRCRYLDTWCQTHMIHKFIGMMGAPPEHYLDLTKANFTLMTEITSRTGGGDGGKTTSSSLSASSLSPYICFDHAVAGLGVLTDHGTNQRHGQYLEDYLHPHNAVRGPILFDFRNWVLRNLNISDRTIQRVQQQQPFDDDDRDNDYDDHRVIRITMSINSTKDPLRFWNTPDYFNAIESLQLQSSDISSSSVSTIQVQSVVISQLSAEEQIQLAVQSTMFISVVGGGSVTAMWLPPGASLILFYPVLTADQMNDIVQAMLVQRKGHRQSDQYLTNVARLTLDWDVWNHLSYLRVHWLPLPSSKEEQIVTAENGTVTSVMAADLIEQERSIQLLLQLIRHEAAFLG